LYCGRAYISYLLGSGLYIYRTFTLMRSSAAFRGPDFKTVFHHLILVNILVISLDITILAFQYTGLYEIQTSWKTLAYSIKLNFEFDILHQLVDFTKRGLNGQGHSGPRHIGGTISERGTTHASVQEITAVHMSGSCFNNAAYARIDEYSLEDVPMQQVKKITEIHVEIEEDMGAPSVPGSSRTLLDDRCQGGGVR
jgi:hypothetical protein